MAFARFRTGPLSFPAANAQLIAYKLYIRTLTGLIDPGFGKKKVIFFTKKNLYTKRFNLASNELTVAS